jgi:hypothetical protein
LFTDVEGSTRRWEADADGMRMALATHDKVLRTAIHLPSSLSFGTKRPWAPLTRTYRLTGPQTVRSLRRWAVVGRLRSVLVRPSLPIGSHSDQRWETPDARLLYIL